MDRERPKDTYQYWFNKSQDQKILKREINSLKYDVESLIYQFTLDDIDYREADGAIEAIERNAEIFRLREIIQYAISLSEEGNLPLDLDSPLTLPHTDFMEPGFFPLSSNYQAEAVESGNKSGTRTALKLMVPTDIKDDTIRSVYYMKRHDKQLLNRYCEIHEQEDGSWTAALPTRLPNVGVYFVNPAGSNDQFRILYSKQDD